MRIIDRLSNGYWVLSEQADDVCLQAFSCHTNSICVTDCDNVLTMINLAQQTPRALYDLFSEAGVHCPRLQLQHSLNAKSPTFRRAVS